MDTYGCSLFNSINLFEAFNVNSLKSNISKVCIIIGNNINLHKYFITNDNVL